jgi:hypothetical protein
MEKQGDSFGAAIEGIIGMPVLWNLKSTTVLERSVWRADYKCTRLIDFQTRSLEQLPKLAESIVASTALATFPSRSTIT